MGRLRRVLSRVLLVAGLLLIASAIIGGLGWTIAGTVTGAVSIAALLYAGGVWFGTAPRGEDRTVIVFDRQLRIASGPGRGLRLLDSFPAAARDELARRCTAALMGESAEFACGSDRLQTTPIWSAYGTIPFGVLLTTAPVDETEPIGRSTLG